MASLAPFVVRRGAVYHIRCRIPLDLVALIGKAEYKRSLATTCPRIARKRATLVRASLTRVFDEIRTMPTPQEDLARILLDTVEEYENVEQARNQAEDMRSRTVALKAATTELGTLEAHSRELEALRVLADAALAVPMPEEARRAVKASIRARLKGIREEMDAAAGSKEIVELASKVSSLREQLAHTEATATERIAELEGKVSLNLGHLGSMLADMGIVNRRVETPTVSEYLNGAYLEEKRLQDDAKRHIISYVDLFARVTGDRKLAAYERRDVVFWIRTIERMKNSYGKSPKDRKMTVEQLLQSSKGKKTFNTTTLEKHLIHVKAFFRSAARAFRFASTDDIDLIFQEVEFSDFVPGAQPRKPWLPHQLTELFASPVWSGTDSGPPHVTKRHLPGTKIHREAYWWLPVLALWTGARLEELAQLHHEDLVRDVTGIPFIKIHDDGIRRVKNPHSIRNVPIHSMLIRLGFLDLFDPRKKGQRIFMDLSPSGRLKKLGDTYSTHFTDYRRRCGLYEELRDFHSFRRTFIGSLRTKAKVDIMTIAAMAGHDQETEEARQARQTDDYTDYDIAYLKDAIEKLDYTAYGADLAPLLRFAKKEGAA